MSTRPQGRTVPHAATPEMDAAGPPLRDALTTAIAMLNDLQAELRNAERIVNDGEDPEAAKEQSANAENALRRILDDPPATHVRLAPESDPSKRHIDAMFEEPPSSRVETLTAVQEAFIAMFRPLPLKHLRALEALVNRKASLRQRDEENIAAGFTIGQLKALLSTQIGIRQLDLHKSQTAARHRVFREIDLLLAAHEHVLKAKGLSGLVPAIQTESIDSILHQFSKLEAKLCSEDSVPPMPKDDASTAAQAKRDAMPAHGPVSSGEWEVRWDESDANYIGCREAREKFTDGKPSESKLSKLLGEIPVHYMRAPGKGARVHLVEYRLWAAKRFPLDPAAIADEWLADIEARKAQARARKPRI